MNIVAPDATFAIPAVRKRPLAKLVLPSKVSRLSPRALASAAPSRALERRLSRQLVKAHIGATIVVILLAISLYDQANGIHIIAPRAHAWQCWALAVGIELGFVSLKMDILLAATSKVRRTVGHYAMPAIYATVIASAIMNAFSMADGADGWLKIPAAAIGVLVSFLIFQISQSTAHLYLGGDRA